MKRVKKAIIFILALALVLGLMTVNAFAITYTGSGTANLYSDYSKTFYGLYGAYHATVASYLSSWGWTIGDALQSDIDHDAYVSIDTMNNVNYHRTGSTINSNGKVSTGTCNTAVGEYAKKVYFSMHRKDIHELVIDEQWTVTHNN